ncbi:hypothetical protein [Streptomyces sp. BRB081]|uniref:hypothetical protein n=1 Tax=Streptomyces sp. BRB081 TaxID=2769544 RepID=UPI0018AD0247|nr:hypothetical protein [Streptomyces sp. BRB081]MBL3808310.1 hypothetical protein [Streptomyces sp. BRB081]
MQVLDWNDFDAQVKMALQGGSTPDVLQTVGYVHKVADDLFQRAEEVLFPATPDRFVDAFAQAGGMDGARYGIRCVSSTRVLIPNEKLRRRRRRRRRRRAGEELGRHQIGCGARQEEGPRRGLVRAAARS